MYQERKHELIFISKETATSQRHGEYPLRETKMTISNPQDLGSVLDDLKGFLQAAGYSFVQELNHTAYTWTEEDGIYNMDDSCCNQGCCSEEDKEAIVTEPKKEEIIDVSNR